ncbi:B-type cyclin CLB3 [Sugiyamaella lignohabitans]|uniref:B-type cyclin CLB3 n=1 Tax=Sugiyamaella lignohabitans TaxID=796027 RepID=A0A167EZF5_9ASCO|nr:B-type cyclin CLB3 [Sugiyamaella lignohabitans]ANB14638.1 B-type cyclin CLB3 [Sugiyamaella lignohabitans]
MKSASHSPQTGPYRRRPRKVNDHALDMMAKEMSQQVHSEYGQDIIAHMDKMQRLTAADAGLMDLQPEIEWHMRPFLLDFLIDTHVALRLQPQTLFLAINLIDRYCSMRVVYRKHYQLVGCTALWIAAKYEDKKSRIPTINDLTNMCCKAYEGDMFVQMEGHVLNTLNWTIGHPTVQSYLDVLVASESTSPTVRHVAQYLCEISLYHRAFISLTPSAIASAAFNLAKHLLTANDHAPFPVYLSSEENQTMSLLYQHMNSPSKSLHRKYSSSTLSQATHLVSSFLARQQRASLRMPPTPPPSSLLTNLTPPSLSSSVSSATNSPGESPIYATTARIIPQHSKTMHIKIPAPFKSEGYLTPPCTPDDINGPLNNRSNSIASVASAASYHHNSAFTSVPMEYTQSMET